MFLDSLLNKLLGPPDIERLRTKGAIRSLIRALSHRDPAVQCAAADALKALYGSNPERAHAGEVVQALARTVFDTGREEHVCETAMLALISMRNSRAVEPLLAMLQQFPEDDKTQ